MTKAKEIYLLNAKVRTESLLAKLQYKTKTRIPILYLGNGRMGVSRIQVRNYRGVKKTKFRRARGFSIRKQAGMAGGKLAAQTTAGLQQGAKTAN